MKVAFLLTSFLDVISSSTDMLNHACHFAGARFARVVSICEEGLCSGLIRHATGQFEGTWEHGAAFVRCVDAKESVDEFRARSSVPVRRSKRPRLVSGNAPELLEMLRVSVFHLLQLIAFGSIGIAQPFSGFRLFDDRSLAFVTSSFAQWSHETAPALLSAPLLHDIRRCFEQIIHTGLHRSFAYVHLRVAIQTAIHFYFDLAALLGHHFLDPQAIEIGSSIVENSEPGYRAVTRWEMYAGLSWQGVPTETSALLSVSVTIDRLADLAAEPVSQDLWVLFKLMSGWYVQPRLSQVALIEHQITSSLCPNLAHFIDKVSRSLILVIAKTVVLVASLVDACHASSSILARKRTRHAIVRWVTKGQGVQPELTAEAPAYSCLAREDITWSLGLPESMTDEEKKGEAVRLLAEFTSSQIEWVPKGLFRVMRPKNDLHWVPKALGRALGLAILHEVDLSTLRIHPGLAGILYPSFRLLIPSVSDFESAAYPASAGFVLMASIGIQDVLGLGGFEMFSDREWMALFGHDWGTA